jgi:hypothetical protein
VAFERGEFDENKEEGDTPIMKPIVTIAEEITTARCGAFWEWMADTTMVIGRTIPRAIWFGSCIIDP